MRYEDIQDFELRKVQHTPEGSYLKYIYTPKEMNNFGLLFNHGVAFIKIDEDGYATGMTGTFMDNKWMSEEDIQPFMERYKEQDELISKFREQTPNLEEEFEIKAERIREMERIRNSVWMEAMQREVQMSFDPPEMDELRAGYKWKPVQSIRPKGGSFLEYGTNRRPKRNRFFNRK